MRKNNPTTFTVRQFALILKNVDQKIEEWVHHFIDQVEKEYPNQSD